VSANGNRLEQAVAGAQRLLQEGKPAEACASFERVLKDAPLHPIALKLGAVAAFQSGDGARSVEMLETAIAHVPEDHEAHFNLGVVYQSSGVLDAALACFSRAARLSPESADAHYNAATALHELGRSDEAVTTYRHAIDANARYAPAYAGLAYALRGLGRLEEALTAYENAVALAPHDAQARSGYGITL
jgi:tetratricopeptide (TPR) repeat protein